MQRFFDLHVADRTDPSSKESRILAVDIASQRMGPMAVRVQGIRTNGSAAERELAQVDLGRWALELGPDDSLPNGPLRFVAMGGSGVRGEYASILVGHATTAVGDPLRLPSSAFRASIRQVAALDFTDPTRSHRARMILSLDLFTMATSPQQDHPAIIDAREELKKTIKGAPLEVSAKDLQELHLALAEATAAVMAGKPGEDNHLPNAVALPPVTFQRVRRLFAKLTYERLSHGKRATAFPVTDEQGKAIVADLVRFTSGNLHVPGDLRSGYFNCSPNGANYLLLVTMAMMSEKHYRSSKGKLDRRHTLWEWWARAAVAGLEVFIDCMGNASPARNLDFFEATTDYTEAICARWHRARMANLVEYFSDRSALPFEQVERRFVTLFRSFGIDSTETKMAGRLSGGMHEYVPEPVEAPEHVQGNRRLGYPKGTTWISPEDEDSSPYEIPTASPSRDGAKSKVRQ